MKTITQNVSTPKKDGFRMPGEFEPQDRVWMAWPHRCDTWAFGAKPAQVQYANIAKAIAKFTPLTMCVNEADYKNAQALLGEVDNINVIEMTTDDAWVRDTGATFLVNDKGEVRANHWHFNAYGGFFDGLYFPWDKDEEIALKMCELAGVVRYRPDDFILEGGSFHVDGEGTVITTEMCLLSEGRNPQYNKSEIEDLLKEYLNCEKVIWVKDGIDEEETTGHIDDVACYARPGEVICIWTDDEANPFYQQSHDAFETLSNATDAKGRKLKVHKLCLPVKPTYMPQAHCDTIDIDEMAEPRVSDEPCIASYLNFLITNKGVIVPQYGDENDALAISQLSEIFPDHEVVGVKSQEVVYGGGNIHCITQQQPSPQKK